MNYIHPLVLAPGWQPGYPQRTALTTPSYAKLHAARTYLGARHAFQVPVSKRPAAPLLSRWRARQT